MNFCEQAIKCPGCEQQVPESMIGIHITLCQLYSLTILRTVTNLLTDHKVERNVFKFFQGQMMLAYGQIQLYKLNYLKKDNQDFRIDDHYNHYQEQNEQKGILKNQEEEEEEEEEVELELEQNNDIFEYNMNNLISEPQRKNLIPNKKSKSNDQQRRNKKLQKNRPISQVKPIVHEHPKSYVYRNIITLLMRRIKSQNHVKEVSSYCDYARIFYKDIQFIFQGHRQIGRGLLSNWMSLTECNGFKKVFALFMVRFLSDQFLHHVESQKRLIKKDDYMECAREIVRYPTLNEQQIDLVIKFSTQ